MLFNAAPAFSATSYLQCPVKDEKGKSAVNVALTLNEDAGTAAIYFQETGYSLEGLPATFTPEAVRWEKVDDLLHSRFTIDRSTLGYVETLSVRTKTLMTRKGTCTLSQPREPKF
ncbi:hypothetical protein [Sphingomonas arenae]|nr:hypothetical protein [Sphingomonas arenae]